MNRCVLKGILIFISQVCDRPALLDSSETNERLAELDCALVYNSFLNISVAVPYLAKLAAVKLPLGNMVLRVKDQSGFATVINDSNSFKRFVAKSVERLCPLLCSMGSALPGGFADTESVREIGPKYVLLSLKTAAETAFEREMIDDTRLLSRETTFLKPFRDDVDSRHEYKNQVILFDMCIAAA